MDNKPTATAEAPKRVWIPPTSSQVQETVLRAFGSQPLATARSPITFLSFNGRYLDLAKAERLTDPLLELVHRAHVICLQETNVDAARFLARRARYGLNASHRNVRQQACAMLFHPRFQWLGNAPTYHDYLLDVPGHPEFRETQRPAIQRRIHDLSTNKEFEFVGIHAKSNIGEEMTRDIRHWQFGQLAAELDRQQASAPPTVPRVPVILAGDYNAPIDNPETTEIEPLLAAGFRRIATPDNRWTYKYFEKGGQFDGFFVRGLDDAHISCFVPPFFSNRRDAAFMREFSDHLPVFMTVEWF